MIICSNCGATNSDETSRFCRKCGALLPVSSTSQRIRIPKINLENQKDEIKISSTEITPHLNSKSKKKTPHKIQLNGQLDYFTSKQQKSIPNQDELHEIPKPKELKNSSTNTLSPPKIIETEDIKTQLEDIPISNIIEIENDNIIENENEKRSFLKEIVPKPFDGSIISSTRPYTPPKEASQTTKKQQSISQVTKSDESILKQKQLEMDMTQVLAVLSNKIKIPKKATEKKVNLKIQQIEVPTEPSSMNEILTQVLKLDQFIEASALIKVDGTILASALSNRISDTLFLTIGQNLSMIGNDVIEGLSAGKLSSISIRGTEGVLDLAPIDKKIPELNDIILMIFSHSRVKPGIIAFAVNIVKKQIKEYLGLE